MAAPVASSLLAAASLALSGCAPPSRVGGTPAAPPAPSAVWAGPVNAGRPLSAGEARLATRGSSVPPGVAPRMSQLSMVDVVDLALSNSPQTRVTWAQARAAAAAFGSVAGRYLPSLELDATAGPAKSVSQNPARIPAERTTSTPSLSLSYLLFDFGGRGGATQAAHEALFAADLTHNAAVQTVVLQAEGAYFTFQASRGLLVAARLAQQTARTNLTAAERRHDVGLATIADVLQARTALAQAELATQSAEGNVQGARAGLAVAIGLPANGPFDVVADTGAIPAGAITASVDTLIERAVRDRPDVAAARALARQSAAQVRIARSALLPTVNFIANRGRVYSNNQALNGDTYALSFGVAIPLFSGNSREFDVATAKENAAAAGARAEQVRIVVIAQVFSSYYFLRTATQRVATAEELLTSATRSEEVARGRYAEGVGSILDLLSAQSALADARAQEVNARWAWRAALAQLAHDAGVLGPRGETNLTLSSDPTGRPGK